MIFRAVPVFFLLLGSLWGQADFIPADLKKRALAALDRPPETLDLAKLEDALFRVPVAAVEPRLYVPDSAPREPVPVVIYVSIHPGEDPDIPAYTAKGSAVLHFDFRAAHETREDVIPQRIFQQSIRKSLNELLERKDIDTGRISVTGPAAVVWPAALLNPSIGPVNAQGGQPAWRHYLEAGKGAIDACELIPGVLPFAPVSPWPSGPELKERQPRAPGVATHYKPKAATSSIVPGPLPPEGRITLQATIAVKQRAEFETEPGFRIPVNLYRPGPEGGDAAKGVLIAINDEGREALDSDPFLREASNRGWMIFAVDVRGIGELKIPDEAFVKTVTTLLGEDFAWRQAGDLARVIAAYGSADRNQMSGMYAKGKLASRIALYAGFLAGSGRAEWMVLQDADPELPTDLVQAQSARILYTAAFPE